MNEVVNQYKNYLVEPNFKEDEEDEDFVIYEVSPSKERSL